jgi:hypothetical protein
VRDKLALAAIVAVAAGTLFALMTREQPPTMPAPAPAAVKPAAQPPAPGLAWLQPTGPQPASAPPPLALAEQIDRLVATRDPANAYAAYRLLADCISFNRDGDRIVFEDNRAHRGDIRALSAVEKTRDALLCAGMTERMRQSRLDYLAIATVAPRWPRGRAILWCSNGKPTSTRGSHKLPTVATSMRCIT